MKWNTQIRDGKNCLITRLRKRSAAIRNIKKIINIKFAKQLANSIFYSILYHHIEIIGSTTLTNIRKIDAEILKLAKFLNGKNGYGKTSEWHLRNQNWLNYTELFEYCTAKFTNRLIHSESSHHIKYEILEKRRGRNLAQDKLGPINENLGRHAATQATFPYHSNRIYNSLPANLTLIDRKDIFKKYAKKYFLNKKISIEPKPRKSEIIQSFDVEYDDECSIQDEPFFVDHPVDDTTQAEDYTPADASIRDDHPMDQRITRRAYS